MLFRWRQKITGIPDSQLLVRAMTLSDAGCVRQNNEDCAGFTFLAGSKTDFLAVLADGMGGYERGEVASGMMVNAACSESHKISEINPLKWMKKVFKMVNAQIYETAIRSNIVMGTTCTILLVWKKRLYCGHIGDSRLYLLQNNQLHQITTDHTMVNELLRSKKITKAEAVHHQQRNILTKAVGTKPTVIPDIFRIRQTVGAGSRFLLCSDGIYDMLSDKEIGEYLSKTSIRESVHSIIASAKEKGGYDNLTVTVVEINDKNKFKYDE
jgi:protein phosphatase